MANTKSIFDIWDDSVGLGRSYVGRGSNGIVCDNSSNDNEKPYVRLFNAVAKGSLVLVNDILEKESKDDLTIDALVNNFNCLHIACKKGYDEIILAILAKYPDMLFTRTQPDYRTTLMIAAFEKQDKVLIVLWDQFLKISTTSTSSLPNNNNSFLSMIDASGNTALHYAAWGGSNICTKFLLEHCHSDAWQTNNETMTPLQFAVVKNKLEIVKYLSNMMMKNKGFTLQDIAAETSITGYNSIHRAAMYGSLDTIKYLLDKDNDDDDVKKNTNQQTYHDIRTGNGSTALHLASSHGHLDLVKYLIHDHNADVNVQNEYGSTPLHSACSGGHLEVVKLLIDSNSDCNLRQTNGSSALHVAASNGRHDIIQLLINDNNKGVDIFAKDGKGHTAIDSALSMGYKELAGKIALAQFISMRKQNLLTTISLLKMSDF
jgi:ankyrin repeat protein